MLTANDAYVEYLTHKLNETNDKLSSSISLELSELKNEEMYLQSLLESKARKELISTIERDLAMDSLKTNKLNHSLRNSNTLTHSLNNNSKYIGYLERDLEIEKLKALNDTINSRALATTATERFDRSNTTDLYDNLLRQSLKNDSLRSHFLVHKPGEECSICSPNNIYINTLRHSSDNLKSFLHKSINPHEKKKEEPKIAPNVIYSTQKFKKSVPLTYNEYLKTFNTNNNDQEIYNSSMLQTYDKKFKSLSNSLNRSDFYDRDNEYDLDDNDTVYKKNKYHNKYHTFNYSTLDHNMPRKTFRSTESLRSNNRHRYLKKAEHNKPWSYGKVNTPHYEYRDTKLSKR